MTEKLKYSMWSKLRCSAVARLDQILLFIRCSLTYLEKPTELYTSFLSLQYKWGYPGVDKSHRDFISWTIPQIQMDVVTRRNFLCQYVVDDSDHTPWRKRSFYTNRYQAICLHTRNQIPPKTFLRIASLLLITYLSQSIQRISYAVFTFLSISKPCSGCECLYIAVIRRPQHHGQRVFQSYLWAIFTNCIPSRLQFVCTIPVMICRVIMMIIVGFTLASRRLGDDTRSHHSCSLIFDVSYEYVQWNLSSRGEIIKPFQNKFPQIDFDVNIAPVADIISGINRDKIRYKLREFCVDLAFISSQWGRITRFLHPNLSLWLCDLNTHPRYARLHHLHPAKHGGTVVECSPGQLS